MFRNKCLICSNDKLSEIINLGSHPFADTFITESLLSTADKVYPLIVDMCPLCYAIQLRTETSPEERYEETDYSYTSSNSKISREHWDSYAKETAAYTKLITGSSILEIGSNDGYLLQQYKNLGYIPFGIDASAAMCKLANDNSLPTSHSLFSLKLAKQLKEKQSYKLIVANNVFNHANNPLDFAFGVKLLLDEFGTFIFELPYWISGIKNNKFDQIYHEHVTYYTVSHAVKLFESVGMCVNHVDLVDYHGGSIRVFVSFRQYQDSSVLDFIVSEEEYLKAEFYKKWFDSIKINRNVDLMDIYEKASNGEIFVAVGAAAKGNTFLNYYNLDSSIIKYVTDSSPHKQGKFTPRTRIPIVPDQMLSGLTGTVNVIMLSWNISQHLKEILLKINPNLRFFDLEV